MTRPTILGLVVIAAISLGSAAHAAERTVTLRVERMTCASCPVIVRGALRRVEGVRRVKVSYASKTATVTYDDGRTTVTALGRATGAIGYPSRPVRSRP